MPGAWQRWRGVGMSQRASQQGVQGRSPVFFFFVFSSVAFLLIPLWLAAAPPLRGGGGGDGVGGGAPTRPALPRPSHPVVSRACCEQRRRRRREQTGSRPGAGGRRWRGATGRAPAAGPAECRSRRHGRWRRRRPSQQQQQHRASRRQRPIRCIGACPPASAARWRAVAGQTCWPPPTIPLSARLALLTGRLWRPKTAANAIGRAGGSLLKLSSSKLCSFTSACMTWLGRLSLLVGEQGSCRCIGACMQASAAD